MASSVDNPPRTSLEGPQSGPIPLFDFHLRILADSYISFFQERKRIEEIYIESLTRLHQKSKAIDTYLDDHVEINSTRRAWDEVRDNVERETQAREAFLNTLLVDVLNPLINMRETQDRTRKRVKEELKESTATHAEFAESQLPKLKRAYIRKCQEVEEHKAASLISPSAISPTAHDSQPLAPSRSNPSLPSRPSVTSPQPLRPLDRRPSGSMPRNRSPSSASAALQDLAHQGKKQLNQLITFLDKGQKEGLGGRGQDSALRSVRAKREADEADKEYRKAVHWAETLRLRRVKTLEAGYSSLERFVLESTETVKRALITYTDNMLATCATQSQLASHARQMVDRISPGRDTSRVSAHIPRSLAMAIPKPILYYNYRVGECRDLIFGVSMVDYATSRGLVGDSIPKIVKICIEEIDQRGLECEGIYRVSGRFAVVQELQHKIERDEQAFQLNPVTDDVYSVSSLLKLYLRELPEPLFRFPLQDRIQHTADIAEHTSNGFVLLRAKMRRLPPIHRATLKALVEHLSRVAANCDKNKMDAKNLAIVFGGVIFGEDEMPQGTDLLSVQTWKDSLMEDLIENAQILYDDGVPPSSPPLPPAPAGEPVSIFPYGSSHTRVSNVPLPNAAPRRPNESDFAPQLPPRPTNSIHPSARNSAMSPPKLPIELPPSLRASQRQGGSDTPTVSRGSPPPFSVSQRSDDSSIRSDPSASERTGGSTAATPITRSFASTPSSLPSPTSTTNHDDFPPTSDPTDAIKSPASSSHGHS